MKVVIAGAGEVGRHLAKMLSRERHDIILLDPNEDNLAFAKTGMEILPIVGNPTSLHDLENADVRDANLFVSVTTEESTNITACMLASNLGARKTFARINNHEYLLPRNNELFQKIGVNSMICPEILAAKEIVAAIRRPWTRQYWELFGGGLILLGIKVRGEAPIINRTLVELMQNDKKCYHIVAIQRGEGEMVIPRGMDHIEDGDIVFVTTTREHIEDVRIKAGKLNPEVKKVIIMGGGRIAIKTAHFLPDNTNITIIEADRDKCAKISAQVPKNVLVIHGDGRDTDLLVQEGIDDAQAFVALTENAGTNILACLAAKRYGVFKTIAQVENLDYISLAAKVDIGTVINKKLIAAGHIYQFLLDADVTNVKCLAFARADVAELVAKPDSKITRKPIKDMRLPKDMTLGGLIRNGIPMMVEGDTQIRANDHVMVFCFDSAMRKLKDYFN
mgnify:FL=1